MTETYTAPSHCDNCGFDSHVVIPEGNVIGSCKCPRCKTLSLRLFTADDYLNNVVSYGEREVEYG